uniref:Spermatogenesis-associated protein 2 PUB-like domain-containing protein n=1 Tax=Chelydra serpentina TaxID=8475 RepID=A0A8C3RUM2_CHESE
MKELKAAAPAKQDILRDYVAYYGTKWSEGKLLICNETTIKAKAKHFLESGACPAERFSRFSFYSIAENCLKMKTQQGGDVFKNLIQAFEFLELLCINLFLSPWRKEIKSLKTFTGNFVYCVQSVLPENVVKTTLEKIGYIATTATEYSLVRKINEEETKETAFEIFLARIECETILEMINEVQQSDLGDILKKRAQMHWCHEENKDRESQPFQREDPENLGNKENNEISSCLGAQQKSSTKSEKSFETAGNSKIKDESHFKPAAAMPWLASTQSTSRLQAHQRQVSESAHSHGKCSDSEDFLNKYSDIVIGQKPIFSDNSSQKAFEEKLRGDQSEECVLVISTPLTTNEGGPKPLSPGASGPQAFAIFTDGTLESRNALDQYRAQEVPEETIEAKISDAMTCIGTLTNSADQPQELKPLSRGNTVLTECNLTREDKVCEMSLSFSKLKIQEASDEELMYPVEETAQPECITNVNTSDKDIRECNHSKMKYTYPARVQTTNKALFSVGQSSSNLLGNASGGPECPTTGSDNKRLLIDTPGTHATSEGFRHIREPPNLTYIPPRSLYVPPSGPSTTTVNCRKSHVQPEGGSLESSSSTDKGKFETYTSKVNETNQEDYVIISQDGE